MKRNEIETSLTWDLSSMFESQEAYDQTYAEAKENLEKLCEMKGNIAASKDHFIAFMNQKELVTRQISNLVVYAHMFTDVDPENEQAQMNLAKSYALHQQATVKTTFVALELIAGKDKIEAYLNEEDCKDFIYPMQDLYRSIPHRLDDEKEAILAQFNDICQTPSNAFSALRLEYKPVLVDGKEEFLNGGTYQIFLKNKDVNVRKQAFENYFSEYKKYQNLFMNLLTGNAKAQSLEAKFRNFGSALEASLFEDGVTPELFELVLKNANETYVGNLHEYFATRKAILKLDEQHPYDVNLPLVESASKKYSIDDAFAILKEALKPLGEDYVAMLDVARAERWFDFMPHEKKRSGAYSSGTHDSKPFMLLNFTGEYESVSTMAHEFGHSMHSYYARSNNRALLSHYTIFVAEVASTVNELLLNHYLLNNSDDKEYKASLLSNLLTQLVGTLYRQPMFARFEEQLHSRMEKGEALSSKDITDMYYKLNENYFGPSTVVDELQSYGCYYIPHFYYNFYVYKYTLGMSVAINFARRILKGDVEDYRRFLTRGGSMSPLDQLIEAGCDPRAQSVYDDAFTYFKEILDEFKSLMNE